ncbi:DPEP2 Dipeptidase, partial [Acromyrmex heyeri]
MEIVEQESSASDVCPELSIPNKRHAFHLEESIVSGGQSGVWIVSVIILSIGTWVGRVGPRPADGELALLTSPRERLETVRQVLSEVPLIDGHNDLPWNIRNFLHNQLAEFDFNRDLRQVAPWSKSAWSQTDLVRLRQGMVGGQFWAAYVPCESQHLNAVQLTLEQLTVMRDVECSKIIYCDRQSDNSVFNYIGINIFFRMNRTESCELNLIKIHESITGLKFPVRRCEARSNSATIELLAPFSHACFQADNGGLVMVTFYNYFVKCGPQASVSDVAEHIYYIRNLIGVDYIGVGGDFDGINKTPRGLEDVSKYPELFAELLRSGKWDVLELKKVAGLNLLRVLTQVERVRDDLRTAGITPLEEYLPDSPDTIGNCALDINSVQRVTEV